MPSFAYEVKSELTNIKNLNECCNTAQLNGMLKVGAELIANRIDFNTNNAAVARNLLKLIKLVCADAKTEVAVIRNKKFRVSNRYVIRILLNENTAPLFKEMKVNKTEKNH